MHGGKGTSLYERILVLCKLHDAAPRETASRDQWLQTCTRHKGFRSLSQHLRTQMDEASPAQISTVVNRYARANLADEAKVFIPRTMRLLSDMDSKQLSGVQLPYLRSGPLP